MAPVFSQQHGDLSDADVSDCASTAVEPPTSTRSPTPNRDPSHASPQGALDPPTPVINTDLGPIHETPPRQDSDPTDWSGPNAPPRDGNAEEQPSPDVASQHGSQGYPFLFDLAGLPPDISRNHKRSRDDFEADLGCVLPPSIDSGSHTSSRNAALESGSSGSDKVVTCKTTEHATRGTSVAKSDSPQGDSDSEEEGAKREVNRTKTGSWGHC
ncbi:uncharacterized protein DNG_01634 [Cephalotrichum gorgonifer]|uniref:Uncharacterized protein n=1 Tax=Cephalotrichum gorgonifer TaxID=2041049 RepID=A0AAE8MT01_9PEZI|nr:uncharacterized protein DNG_01634 [Cephalotrichum gorgonifer]